MKKSNFKAFCFSTCFFSPKFDYKYFHIFTPFLTSVYLTRIFIYKKWKKSNYEDEIILVLTKQGVLS